MPGDPSQAVAFVMSGMKCNRCGLWIWAGQLPIDTAMAAGAGMIRQHPMLRMFEIP